MAGGLSAANTSVCQRDNRCAPQGCQRINHAIKSLKILDLERTQISDAGLVHLVEMRSLKILDVEYMQISGPGIQQLKVSLPGCQVIGP